jgi:hypothetical protein
MTGSDKKCGESTWSSTDQLLTNLLEKGVVKLLVSLTDVLVVKCLTCLFEDSVVKLIECLL